MFFSCVSTPIGVLTLVSSTEGLTEIRFGNSELHRSVSEFERDDKRFDECASALYNYFEGKAKNFEIRLDIGTGHSLFFRRVWEELRKIPYGYTRSYGEIAKAIGKPKAARAVGLANNRNPIPILIPCHRVIGSDGSLVGYGGGLDVKTKLLDLERSNSP